VNKPKSVEPGKIRCIYCRNLRECDGQMTCDECREKNAAWVKASVDKAPPMGPHQRAHMSWLLRQ
jgi:hypothetical protein